jgi:ankyrin repeat protein
VLLGACGGDDAQPAPRAGDADSAQEKTAATPEWTAQDLLNASLQGQMKIVRQATDQGIDVNAANKMGNTPLMLAAYNGHDEVARFLLEQGARIGARNAEGRTPLMFAATGPFPDTVELLLQWKADPNATDRVEGWSPLMFAAAEGNLDVVQALLSHGADASLQDREGETALVFAKNNNHADVVEVLQKKQ